MGRCEDVNVRMCEYGCVSVGVCYLISALFLTHGRFPQPLVLNIEQVAILGVVALHL